jgi:hypothetical protein
MWTHIIEGVDRSIDIKESDPFIPDFDTLALTCGNVAELGHFDEIGHAVLLVPK